MIYSQSLDSLRAWLPIIAKMDTKLVSLSWWTKISNFTREKPSKRRRENKWMIHSDKGWKLRSRKNSKAIWSGVSERRLTKSGLANSQRLKGW